MTRSRTPVSLIVSTFLSGAAALIFLLLWTRSIPALFGVTAGARVTALTLLLAGLFFGALRGASIASRREERPGGLPLLLAALAVYGLVEPLLFRAATTIFPLTVRSLGGGGVVEGVVRALLCAILVIPPAALIGAILPVATSRFATLFGVYAAGGAAGVLTAIVFLIGPLGAAATNLVAVVLAAAAALLARLLGGSPGGDEAGDVVPEETPARDDAARKDAGGAAAVTLFLSGLAVMICFIAWARALSFVIGDSVYAAAVRLSLVLAAAALGVAATSLVGRKIGSARSALSVVFYLFAAATLVTGALVDRLPALFISLFIRWGDRFGGYLAILFVIASIVIFFPMLLWGAVPPLACRLRARRSYGAVRGLASIWPAIVAGGAVGLPVATFALIPVMGTRRTLIAGALVALAAGTIESDLFRKAKGKGRFVLPVAAVVIFIVFAFRTGPWDRYRLNAGFYDHPRYSIGNISRKGFSESIYSHDIRELREGPSVAVVVGQGIADLALQVNGRMESSTEFDFVANTLAGEIPMLLHDDPRKILLIGLGNGVTLGSVAAYPEVEVTCVEKSTEVIGAIGEFHEWNQGADRKPNTRIVHADGRNFLRSDAGSYDVIIAEPSKPYLPDAAILYHRETYEAMLDRLEDGGIACLSFDYYGIAEESFRSIIRTFLDVFQYAQLWNVDNRMILLGSASPLQIDVSTMQRRLNLPAIGSDLARVKLDSPYLLLGHFVFGEKEARQFAGDGPIVTDGHSRIEFEIPRDLEETGHEKAFDAMIALQPKYNAYPLKGHLLQDGDRIWFILARYRFSSPIRWAGVFATMERNAIPSERAGAEAGSYLLAYRTEAALTGEKGEEFGITAFSRAVFPPDKLDRTIDMAAEGLSEKGRTRVNGHVASWGTGMVGGRPLAVVTWFCRENHLQYLLRLAGREEDSPADLKDALVSGSMCDHKPEEAY